MYAQIDLRALPVALCWSEDDKASLTLYEDQRIWELTQRPVDRAFAGLRPLADRIGSLSARMALWFWADDLRAMLGERVFSSAERRVGTECVSTCRSRWAPSH